MIYTCQVCKKRFGARPSAKRKYCSFKCRNIDYKSRFRGKNSSFYKGGKTKTYICLWCKKKFIDFISNKRKYCSTSCASSSKVGQLAKNWKGGLSPKYSRYNGEFTEELKAKIFKRDKICKKCGSINKLQVHHKDFNPINNSLSDLVLLCKSCHGKEHYRLLQQYYNHEDDTKRRKKISKFWKKFNLDFPKLAKKMAINRANARWHN